MDITIKNLGLISEANFTVGDLTVICGKNNTGKTYITYATYGFLNDWASINYWSLSDAEGLDIKFISKLMAQKEVTLSVSELINQASVIFNTAQKNLIKN